MNILIVGGGLAGLSLSEQLRNSSATFKLIHQRSSPSSTAVATGMYNPVVFRRLNASWMIDALLPEMHEFYAGIEERLEKRFIASISLSKRIPSDDYEVLWKKRQADQDDVAKYLGAVSNDYGPVLEAGMLDAKSFQESMLNSLAADGLLMDQKLHYTQLEFKNETVFYQDGRYDLIVFAEGPYASDNPYFNWLPFNICKGEWIIIETDSNLTEIVVNNKTNIIPIGGNRYKLSSTYAWRDLTWEPSEIPPEELISNFKEIYDVSFRVIEKSAGLRPTVADRRPYLGRHPELKTLAIFNGLGSKGVMLAPYFSKHLTEHLLAGAPLIPEVDIHRHAKRLKS